MLKYDEITTEAVILYSILLRRVEMEENMSLKFHNSHDSLSKYVSMSQFLFIACL